MLIIFIINLCLFVQGPTSMFVDKHDETNQISVRKVDIKCVNVMYVPQKRENVYN